jgi:hypothetical protein
MRRSRKFQGHDGSTTGRPRHAPKPRATRGCELAELNQARADRRRDQALTAPLRTGCPRVSALACWPVSGQLEAAELIDQVREQHAECAAHGDRVPPAALAGTPPVAAFARGDLPRPAGLERARALHAPDRRERLVWQQAVAKLIECTHDRHATTRPGRRHAWHLGIWAWSAAVTPLKIQVRVICAPYESGALPLSGLLACACWWSERDRAAGGARLAWAVRGVMTVPWKWS